MRKQRLKLNLIQLQHILLTKTTAAQNEVVLSCHNVHGLYFLAVVLVGTIIGIVPLNVFVVCISFRFEM